MPTRHKILIAIPMLIYVIAIGLSSYLFIRQGDSPFVVIGVAILVFFSTILLLLIPTIVIRTLFFQKISNSGSFIISIWIPTVFIAVYLVYELLSFIQLQPKQKVFDNYFSQGGLEYKYQGKEQIVLIAAQRFTENNVLSSSDFRKYFTVVQTYPNDSSKYEVYYYYADLSHPDTSSMMIIYMVSDSNGNILSHEKLCTNDSARLKDIFYKNADNLSFVTKLIDSLGKSDHH